MRHATLLAKIALSIAALWWIGHSLDATRLRGAFGRFDAGAVAWALVLFVLQALVMGWRWHRITSLLGGNLAPGPAVRWVFIGLFFNQALPSSVGGDVVRVWLLHRAGTARSVAFASVVAERGTGVIIIGLMVTACLPAVWSALGASGLRFPLLATGPILLLVFLAIVLAGQRLSRALPARLAGPVAGFSEALRQVVARPAAAAEMTALGALTALCGFAAAWVLGQRLGIELGLAAYVALVGGAVLMGVLPISLGGWGVRELSMVALFGAVGVKAEDAIALSIAYGVLPLLVSLPGGIAWLRLGAAGTPAAKELGRT